MAADDTAAVFTTIAKAKARCHLAADAHLLRSRSYAIIVAWKRILRLENFEVASAGDAEAGLAAANDLLL
ncbi:hypothetical protein [Paraburkholderia tropica]|uniref:hypothetical protein n=1 Tax=Paraburkholderia tropica TaxID=92647 RepID=UPI002AB74931|nr:hypothetical protein [Paraburkholderia tropica]